MHARDLTSLLRLRGVHGAAYVDWQGHTLVEIGYVPDLLPAHAVRLVSTFNDSESGSVGVWREFHAVGWALLTVGNRYGQLVLIVDEDANLGLIRLASVETAAHLERMSELPLEKNGLGGVAQ